MTNEEKVISLYKYIRDLSKLKSKTITDIREYIWSCYFDDIPNDNENIEINYCNKVEDENYDGNNIVLKVHKPEYEKCPNPDILFLDWLCDGWEYFNNEVQVKEFIDSNEDNDNSTANKSSKEKETREKFNDNNNRVKSYEKWIAERKTWVENQKLIEKTRNYFSQLYSIYMDFKRDSETLEIDVANGFLRDKNDTTVNHPLLMRRVNLNFDDDSNTISIEDTDALSELYTSVFQSMNGVNLDAVRDFQNELRENDYHPLDTNDTSEFLKRLIHQLSSDSIFSDTDEPKSWKNTNRLLVFMKPVFIVRKRIDGALKAVEQIIENISDNGYIPSHLVDIVSGGKIDIPEDNHITTIEEQLAEVGGESKDILLSKEANKEQLEIAQRIELFNGVLVQGPPGTGKTHTIANLIGHFLANDKSVLVTSYTKKALSVLKEKIVPELQNLCVSVLDDSNEDMERSIDGITNYMAKYTSHELKHEMEEVSLERNQVIADLGETRRKIFSLINQECNTIVFNGEEISPSKAAKFVFEHAEDLSYIPGDVKLYSTIPLSINELIELYRSNSEISPEDETELECELPDTDKLLKPDEFNKIYERLTNEKNNFEELKKESNWNVNYSIKNIELTNENGKFSIEMPTVESINNLGEYINLFGSIQEWVKYAIADGKKGGVYKQRWTTLINQIQKTCKCSETIVTEQFGKEITNNYSDDKNTLVNILQKMEELYSKKGKISKLNIFMNKEIGQVLESVFINGQPIQSKEDCLLIIHLIELQNMRDTCSAYWKNLISNHNAPEFVDLDSNEPEHIAQKWISQIEMYLEWFDKDYVKLQNYLKKANIPTQMVFSENVTDAEVIEIEKILSSVENVIPRVIKFCKTIFNITDDERIINDTKATLQTGKSINSELCQEAVKSIEVGDTVKYNNSFTLIKQTNEKYTLKKSRQEYLNKVALVAPQWAEAIRNREGIHGKNVVPESIEEAWKWKQYYGIINSITAEPFSELQSRSVKLSKRYREITSKYAEKSAWYYLLRRTEHDIDMKQALQGWKLTVKSIGKGTGKRAPALRAKARELMSKCQSAVPIWIMPINKALESLNPRDSRFDVVIVDEASQADITALAIVYMAKKIIIVGDDKQVSPMAVGVDTDKITAIQQMYIKDIIPNSHLYNATTSLYDIAATTFQPLMLREHFRCVPDIIGFSNGLSYDYKIKPLRDAGDSMILPAVVNYRVKDGERNGRKKENIREAKAIIALLISCMKQPEYDGKTFGIISMLGDDQPKLFGSLIDKYISPKDINKRRILWGNAANFQGDERDIIFLSLVDSNHGDGPLSMMNFGVGESNRKRYNVAASRAKDQLWVVHSLDTSHDLKPGDMRKRIIDYSVNPKAFENIAKDIESKSESPFEEMVAKALVSKGYHLVQQWQVGAYRIDMVAVYGKKTVAIECDGERFHSGEAKIREDMERQTVLERIGWRFIRIRGSEYFSNPDKSIEQVIQKLNDYGILPEEHISGNEGNKTSDLLQRVKSYAEEVLMCMDDSDDVDVDDTIIYASQNKVRNNHSNDVNYVNTFRTKAKIK